MLAMKSFNLKNYKFGKLRTLTRTFFEKPLTTTHGCTKYVKVPRLQCLGNKAKRKLPLV
jgi:hypothetical protein